MDEIKMFPDDMSALEIDRDNMKKCLVSGLFREEVSTDGGRRSFYTYLTPGLEYNQRCLVIAPPDVSPRTVYPGRISGRILPGRNRYFCSFSSLTESGNFDGSDADYMNKVYVQIQARKYYVTMQDNIYAFGFGRGAVVAQQAAMKMTSEWSGLATFGDLTEAAMLNAETVQEGGDVGRTELTVSAAKVQLPVWMFWQEETGSNRRVKMYWRKQNDAADECISGSLADEIYFPSTICKTSSVNEEKIAQVRIKNHFNGEMTEDIFSGVWDYIGRARRHRCHGTKVLRWYKNPLEYGASLHKMKIGGIYQDLV